MADKETTKTFSNKQEKMIAKVLGGKVTPASGARMEPGDVKSDEWLAECKTHTEPGHTIFFDINVWNKICNESMSSMRRPILIVDDGSQKEDKTWCLVRSKDINKSHVFSFDFPVSVRKNISAKHDKLVQSFDPAKKYLGEFYVGCCFDLTWNNEDVTVIPLSVFKEVIDN